VWKPIDGWRRHGLRDTNNPEGTSEAIGEPLYQSSDQKENLMSMTQVWDREK
jgi:hypothetical protein